MTVDDLTPDALAKLEAKLVADLEVVRKVRVLLEEHRVLVPGAGSAAVAASPALFAQTPQPPRRPYEEIFTDCLKAMPAEGFNLGALKQAMRKAGVNPSDSGVKSDMNRLIRQGKVQVVKSATGRIGSTYRYVVPIEASADKGEHPSGEAASQAESGEPSPP